MGLACQSVSLEDTLCSGFSQTHQDSDAASSKTWAESSFFLFVHFLSSVVGATHTLISPPTPDPGRCLPSLPLPLIKWSWLHLDGPRRLIPDMCRIHLAHPIKAASKSGNRTKAWIITWGGGIYKGRKYGPPFESDSNYLSKCQNAWKKPEEYKSWIFQVETCHSIDVLFEKRSLSP